MSQLHSERLSKVSLKGAVISLVLFKSMKSDIVIMAFWEALYLAFHTRFTQYSHQCQTELTCLLSLYLITGLCNQFLMVGYHCILIFTLFVAVSVSGFLFPPSSRLNKHDQFGYRLIRTIMRHSVFLSDQERVFLSSLNGSSLTMPSQKTQSIWNWCFFVSYLALLDLNPRALCNSKTIYCCNQCIL